MDGKKLYVGNLNYEVTADDLKELFNEYGNIVDVRVIEGKGFGFVEFGENAEAEAAKEGLGGQEFRGRTLKIDEARPFRKRENSSRGDYNSRRY